MRVTLAVVGRVRTEGIATAVAAYERRAARYWKLDLHEVRAERGDDPELVRGHEGERLLQRLRGIRYVACDEGGQRLASNAFAGWLRDARDSGRDTAFVIGGAFGLHESVIERAQMRLALAPWTLPHELARLVLVEQLYRAGTILRGEPYHK